MALPYLESLNKADVLRTLIKWGAGVISTVIVDLFAMRVEVARIIFKAEALSSNKYSISFGGNIFTRSSLNEKPHLFPAIRDYCGNSLFSKTSTEFIQHSGTFCKYTCMTKELRNNRELECNGHLHFGRNRSFK
jgi:hypothetical protein